MSEYTEQAENFLKAHSFRFRAKHLDCKPNPLWAQEPLGDLALGLVDRDQYRCTISGKSRGRVSFVFWQSIRGTEQGEIPSAYDLLSCIQKYDVGAFEDFCSEFGYDTDSRKAEQTYQAVLKEWKKVSRFFTEMELEELQAIQ